ncbi:MAG: CHAT domain-containing protein [Planctomycetia bacterium]|nr:CHAT domain-containing protein [Planctomycetia bacterium]
MPPRLRFGLMLAIAGVWLSGLLLASPAHAQTRPNSDVLNQSYQRAMTLMYSGDYEGALDGFRQAGRGAIRAGETRWIDSICYHAMTGEAYFQTGQMPQALEHFGSALQLYVQYPDWMLRVQFPPSLGPRTIAPQPVPWGQSQRRFRLGQFPDKFSITRGQNTVIQGSTQTFLQQGEMIMTLQAAELVRCTTLAIRRRSELLGPVAKLDHLTQDVVAKLAARPGPPNHWSEVWIDLQLGVALEATGRREQALTALTRSLVAGGEYDHPLTCLAMLELGRIALDKGDLKSASVWFSEASYSGYFFSQYAVIEEAVRLGALVHILSDAKNVYPPLATVADWAHAKRLRALQASALISAAEGYAQMGDQQSVAKATATLSQVNRAMSRRELAPTELGARFNYVSALVAYERRQPKSGEPALTAALAYEKKGSLRLFQMAMVDQAYRDGTVRDKTALDLFAKVLDDPPSAAWRIDPLQALCVLVTPQEPLLDHWLEAAIGREDMATAVEVTDRIRRRRYFNTLPLGGRLLGLRWVLEAPEAALSRPAVLQRHDLLTRYPHYQELARQAEKLQKDLAALPALPEDRGESSQQVKLMTELTRVASNQEAILMEMALRREAITLAFPPLRTLAEVQQRMEPGQAILSFLTGPREIYGFLITPDRAGGWKLASPDNTKKHLANLLRAMGHFDQGREIDAAQLKDTSWRGEAAGLLADILQGSRIDLSIGIQQLTIVPDDFLWYVPFEALQVGKANQTETLLTKMQIRYAPTIGLAVPDGRPRRQGGTTGVVMGRLFPHEPDEIAIGSLKRIKQAVPKAAVVTQLPTVPGSLVAKRLDGLIVLDDLASTDEHSPYQLHPLRLDKGRPGGTLEDWFSLPFGGPELVVLPGFHTPAENSLKRMLRTTKPGEELFLTLCGFMSTGARTVMISRWRVGGRTCHDLIAEWLQELPHTTAADAWQRAVEVARQAPLDLSLEPRVKTAREGETPTAENPFFWSGYMVVDTGTDPRPKPVKK